MQSPQTYILKCLSAILLLLSGSVLCATLVVNENIQNWAAANAYGNYTQQIPAGTISLTSCLVSPNAAASGVGSAGRIQCQAANGIVQLPELSSVGDVQFVFAAGSAGRSVRLQRLINEAWTDITTFSGIGATGTAFYQRVGVSEAITLRLAFPSHAIYIHDIFVTSCSAEPLPEISLPVITNLSYNTATLSVQIESAGNSAITERGFCWSTDPLPDLSDSSFAFGSGISPWLGTITGLEPETIYYLRAYGINSSGTGYSPELQFTTSEIGTPTIQTSEIVLYPGSTSVQAGWTPGNGARRLLKINTVNDFSTPENGQEYAANPVYNGQGEQVVYGGATQIIEGEEINTASITGLQRNTLYWFRAYEVNGQGEQTHYLANTSINNPNSCTTLNTGLAGYYDNISGSGENLKDDLHNLLRNTHLTQFSYDAVWQQLQYTDEDSLQTNNIIETYTGWSVPKSYYGTGADQWNREHTWSVSHGGFGTSRPAGTDLHHLRPCDVTVNSAKGNKDFDSGGTPYVDSTPYPGYSATTGCNTATNFWEPRPVEQGDVARMLFYMAIRYEGIDTSYDLELLDITPTSGPYYGKLSTLLQWHSQDPPDSWERRRNDRIQERQGNRNPFIDHPEFVSRLWVPRARGGVSYNPNSFIAFWTPSLDAVSYRVDVSADSLFGSFIVQDQDLGNVTQAELITGGQQIFFFRVRAFLGSGFSPYSNACRLDLTDPQAAFSYFNATLVGLTDVFLEWSTDYESNLLGFQVLRSETPELAAAMLVSPLMAATNTTTLQNYSFTDSDIVQLDEGRYLYYWISAIGINGETLYSWPDSMWIKPSGVVDETLVPSALKVSVYPNPFSQSTTLRYTAKSAEAARLTIFDLKGRKVNELTLNPAFFGEHRFDWDGRDQNRLPLASGVYFYLLQSGRNHYTGKLLLLK